MKRVAAFAFCVLFVASALGCHTKPVVSEPEPLFGSGAAQEIYIPKDLNDALKHLGSLLGENGRADVLARTEGDMIQYHMSVGLWLRNNWGLWAGSRLAKYFNQIGIYPGSSLIPTGEKCTGVTLILTRRCAGTRSTGSEIRVFNDG